MKKKSYFLILIMFGFIAQSQIKDTSIQKSVLSNSKVLDSIINHTTFGISQIIVYKNNQHYVDTFWVEKIKFSKKDSLIEVKYINKTSGTLKPSELWGYITDYRECRRFYDGKMYTLWRTSTPCIYKLKNKSAIPDYFFSLETTSPIIPLTPENVSRIKDVSQKKSLNMYLQEHELALKNRREENLGTVLSATGEVLVDLLEATLYIFVCALFER